MSKIRCSICGVEFDPKESPAMPFCSRRCKLIDLGRWLEEGYGMPIEPEDDQRRPDDDRDADEKEEGN